METVKYSPHAQHPAFRTHVHTTYIISFISAQFSLPWELCSYIGGYYHLLCQRLVAVADSFAIIAVYNAVYHYAIDDTFIAAHGPGVRHSSGVNDISAQPRQHVRLVPVQPCSIGPWADSSDVTPRPFGPDIRILSISVGVAHGAILTTEGVFGCGSNRVNQLGTSIQSVDRTQMIKIFDCATAISCSSYYTMVISGGKLYGCGANHCGQLGPIAGATVSTFRLVKPFADKQITAVSCQMSYALVLTSEGTVFVVGKNRTTGACAIIATNASAIFTMATARWCFKAPAAETSGAHSEALSGGSRYSNTSGCIERPVPPSYWHMETSTGATVYPEWNTPHSKYDAPAETILALHREQSCLNGDTHPTELGIITAIAQNRVSKDCMISTPNGVFFREGCGSEWIRL